MYIRILENDDWIVEYDAESKLYCAFDTVNRFIEWVNKYYK